ncbi:MAG: ribonuclease P protein component 4 [Candidatus Nanoarchaeia archaeon]
MVRRYQKKPDSQTKIAKERAKILLDKAATVFNKDEALAKRYVTLARKIAMKYKIRFPSELKRRFCPRCYSFLQPGSNLRVRLGKHKLVYSCLSCRRFWRMPYAREIKKRRVKTV